MNESCEDGESCVQQTSIYYERPEEMLDPHSINPMFGTIIATHVLVTVFGVLGNSIVIATWAGSKPARSPTCTFLVSLAVADLLLLLIYVPLETLEYFVITWDHGGNICKMSCYIEMLSGMASVLNLTAVSFERFLVIAFPLVARRYCSVSTCRKGVCLVWFLAILLATPAVVTKKVYPVIYYNNITSVTAYYCWDSNDTVELAVAIYQLMGLFIVPALIMSICYFWVIRELWSSNRNVAAMTYHRENAPVHNTPMIGLIIKFSSSSRDEEESGSRTSTIRDQGWEVQKARRQVIKMLILVIILFLVCWGPRLIMHVMIKYGLTSFSTHVYNTRIAVYLLSFAHSAINPVVYGFMSTNFRKMILQSCPFSKTRNLNCMCTGKVETPIRIEGSEICEFSTCTTSVKRSTRTNLAHTHAHPEDFVPMKCNKLEAQWTSV